jgi:hypothetical protein
MKPTKRKRETLADAMDRRAKVAARVRKLRDKRRAAGLCLECGRPK